MRTRRRSKAHIAMALALFAALGGRTPASCARDLQQQCAQQVSSLFEQTWPAGGAKDDGVQAEFVGHYNGKLDKCFVLERVSRLMRSPALRQILSRETLRLADANGNEDYGKYEGWYDMPPMTCWLQQTSCASREDWLDLVRPFMSQ